MMADPMADLGGGAPGSTSNKEDNASLTTSKEVSDPLILGTNLQRIDRIRSVMGIASGCVAGIGGLTGLQGFLCFSCLHLFVCLSIWAWKMNFNLDAYTKQTWFVYLTTSLQPTALSFTLFWTLFYGLVYLY